jgi:hypothetical protein
MSIWFFIVLVVGILYIVNRLTSTADLPVSAVLAEAREIVEQGHQPDDSTLRPTTPTAAGTEPNHVRPTAKEYAESRAA